jgi:hypothetical protein
VQTIAKLCVPLFPAHIYKQIQGLSPEQVRGLGVQWEAITEVDRELNAALMAARRRFMEQKQDALLARFGIEHQRQLHAKKGETAEEAALRRSRGDVFLPTIERYVQTIPNSAQAPNGGACNAENGFVQTASSLLS